MRKNSIDLSLYKMKICGYSFFEETIDWVPKIEEEQIYQLNNMDISLFNSVGDEYLQKEQRSSTGSFYTPSGIVDFMVYDVIKNYLVNSADFELSDIEKVIKNPDSYFLDYEKELALSILEAILNCRVIDIASGSGVFLISYVRFVKKIMKMFYSDDVTNEKIIELISNKIFATDIRHGPLEMLFIALVDEVDPTDEFKQFIFPSIHCCNSIYGEDLLNLDAVKSVIKSGGFEIVIGNPPYIGEKGHKPLFEELRETSFGEQCYEGKMDMFYFFIYRGYDLLRINGVLSFITTNYFVTADGAKKLRRFMSENVVFKTIVNFNNQRVFSSMKGHNMIFTFMKCKKEESDLNIKYYCNQKPLSKYNFEDLLEEKSSDLFNSYYLEKQNEIYDTSKNINVFPDKKHYEVIKSLDLIPAVNLGNLTSVNQGIVSGADKVSKQMYEKKLHPKNIDLYNINLEDGIFVLNKSEVDDLNVRYDSVLKPFYKNSDIGSYIVKNETERSILYIDDQLPADIIPHISERFMPYKEVLSERREVKNGRRSWYALQWPRNEEIFEKDKIVVPQRSAINKFAWTDKPWYASADVYYITSENNQLDLKVLLGYLNSKLVYYWLYHRGKRKGKDLELYATPLKSIPVPIVLYCNNQDGLLDIIDEIMMNLKMEKADIVISLKNKVDRYIYDLLELDDNVINEIETFYYNMHGW